jgi:sugar (pentulose or hexulose) kinase
MQLAGVDLPDEVLYSKLNELAAKAALNESDLVVDTRFAGVRGDAGIRGGIYHINTTNFNIGELAYAFLEGMTAELYRMAKPMLGGIKRVVASGNAVRKNPLMPAVIAKTFGMECRVSVLQEEAAIGAAAVAAMMLGLLSPEAIGRCLRNE